MQKSGGELIGGAAGALVRSRASAAAVHVAVVSRSSAEDSHGGGGGGGGGRRAASRSRERGGDSGAHAGAALLPIPRALGAAAPARLAGARPLVLCLDLDGVLADFERGVAAATGRSLHGWGALPPHAMWSALRNVPHPGFFASLPWMADGRALWDFAARFSPTIVTGTPRGSWSQPQKRAWCAAQLGAGVAVLTCLAREKARVAGARPGVVLVDDNEEVARAPWEAAGGIFVHHTSAERTIAALRALGFA
jgi:hypothetical protein